MVTRSALRPRRVASRRGPLASHAAVLLGLELVGDAAAVPRGNTGKRELAPPVLRRCAQSGVADRIACLTSGEGSVARVQECCPLSLHVALGDQIALSNRRARLEKVNAGISGFSVQVGRSKRNLMTNDRPQ